MFFWKLEWEIYSLDINQVIGDITVNIKPEFVRHILWVEILKNPLQEIFQLRGEILRRILIVTSLGWKEGYGVEAVKTLWPLSGNTFSCPTGLCIYCRFKTS